MYFAQKKKIILSSLVTSRIEVILSLVLAPCGTWFPKLDSSDPSSARLSLVQSPAPTPARSSNPDLTADCVSL